MNQCCYCNATTIDNVCDDCKELRTPFISLLPKKFEQIDKDAELRKQALRQRALDLQTLKDGGFKVGYHDLNVYQMHIKRSDLPLLRRIVGPLKIYNKSPSYNFDKRQVIDVSIMAKEGFKDIRFTYEVEYKAGGKCHIECVPSVSHVLVCKSE